MADDQPNHPSSLEQRLRINPREAFEELVRTYQADVRMIVRRHLGRSTEADELAQQVFVAIYKNLESFRGEGSLRGWIIGVTVNQIRSYIRDQSRRRRTGEALVSPELLETAAMTMDDDPFVFQDAQQDLQALKDCLARLDLSQRSLVEAFYFQNQSAEAIAKGLGQTSGAVRMLLLRIRERLAKCIRKKMTLGMGVDERTHS